MAMIGASKRFGGRQSVNHALTRAMAACMVLTLGLPGLAACGAGQADSSIIQPNGPLLTVGVASDEKGLGFWHEGAYEGLEADVARYVAQKLGYAKKQVVFKQVSPANRLQRLADGEVDMVVAGVPMPDSASYSGTKQIVASDDSAQYAGPYLTTPQSVLVRPRDVSAATGTAALRDWNVCTVAGSGASERLLAEQPRAHIHQRGSYSQCVTDLMTGTVRAVAGDAVVLAGLARAQARDVAVPAAKVSYGIVRYGIAVPQPSKTLAKNVADALSDMHSDGTLDKYAAQMSAETGWKE